MISEQSNQVRGIVEIRRRRVMRRTSARVRCMFGFHDWGVTGTRTGNYRTTDRIRISDYSATVKKCRRCGTTCYTL